MILASDNLSCKCNNNMNLATNLKSCICNELNMVPNADNNQCICLNNMDLSDDNTKCICK